MSLIAVLIPIAESIFKIIADAVAGSKQTDAAALASLRATLSAAVVQLDADLATLADARAKADAEIAGQ